jgi:DNA-binding NtrC family response regulator
MSTRHILIVDDDTSLRETLQELVQSAGYSVETAVNASVATEMLQTSRPTLILCDWKMPIAGGQYLLERSPDKQIPIIIMTAHGTGPNALKAMELGAYDFITKPLDADTVLATIERAIRHADLEREVQELRAKSYQQDLMTDEREDRSQRLVGTSPAWLEVFKGIGRVANTDLSVLLQGESGTGKEVVARTIHEASSRRQKPFVVVNCATLPAELMESELFGHEKGSFTGAVAQKLGKFEVASGGTVFLDEIGELPLALQPKLLRVLQERTFERIGNTRTFEADFRIIAATNRDLEDEVREKTFRADLFYRLQAFTLYLPPLRERKTDILALAEYFLDRFAARNGIAVSALSPDAASMLQRYQFPGNVRELEHMMDRAAVRSGGRAITEEILATTFGRPAPQTNAVSDCARLRDLPFHESVAAWERMLIETALEEAHGNKSDAARKLGINRRLLYEKLQQFGL